MICKSLGDWTNPVSGLILNSFYSEVGPTPTLSEFVEKGAIYSIKLVLAVNGGGSGRGDGCTAQHTTSFF